MRKYIELCFESRSSFQGLVQLFDQVNLLQIQSMKQMGSTTCIIQLIKALNLKESVVQWIKQDEVLNEATYKVFLKSKKKFLFIDLNDCQNAPFAHINQLKIANKTIVYTNESIQCEAQHSYVVEEVTYEEFIQLLSKHCCSYKDIDWLNIKKLYELSGAHTKIVQMVLNDLQVQSVQNVVLNSKYQKLKNELTKVCLDNLSTEAIEVLEYLSFWYKDNLTKIYEFFQSTDKFEVVFQELLRNSVLIRSQENLFYVPQFVQQSIRLDTSPSKFDKIKTEFLKREGLFCRSFLLFHSYPQVEENYLQLVDHKGPKRSLFLYLIEQLVKQRYGQKLLSDSEKIAYAIYQLESGVLYLAKQLAQQVSDPKYILRAKLLLFRINFLLMEDMDQQAHLLLDLYQDQEELSKSDLAILFNSLSSHFDLVKDVLPFRSKIEVLERAREFCIDSGLQDALHIILINLNLNYRYAKLTSLEFEIQTEILGTIVEFDSPNETKLAYRKIELLIELEHYYEAKQLLRLLLIKSQEAQDLNLLSHYYFYSGMLCILQDDKDALDLLSLAEMTFFQMGDQYRRLLSLSLKALAAICHRNIKDAFEYNQTLDRESKERNYESLNQASKLYQVILLFMQDMKRDSILMERLKDSYNPLISLLETIDTLDFQDDLNVPDFQIDSSKNLLLQKLDKHLFDSLKSEFRFVCFNTGFVSRISQYRSDLYFDHKTRYDLYIDLVQNRFYEKSLLNLDIGRKRSLLNLFVVLCVSRAKLSNADIFQILWQKKYNHETDEPVVRMNINRLKKVIEPVEDMYIQKDLIHGTYFVNPAFKYLIVLHESDWVSIQRALIGLN